MSWCRVTTFNIVAVALVVNTDTGARVEVRFSPHTSLYGVEFLTETFKTIESAIASAEKYLCGDLSVCCDNIEPLLKAIDTEKQRFLK